jgi:HAD superfamily hydrolase (TIGR01509 family)
VTRARGYLLDLDGTLCDSLAALYDVYSQFMAAHGAKATMEEFQRLNGVPLPEIIGILKSTHGLSPDQATLLQHYNDQLKIGTFLARPFPGAETFLNEIRGQGGKIALVTSSPEEHARAWLERNQLHVYFDAVIGGDSINRGKPAPDPYIEGARKLGLETSDCIAIEDSFLGAMAAKESGAQVFVINSLEAPAWLNEPEWTGVKYVSNFGELLDSKSYIEVWGANTPADFRPRIRDVADAPIAADIESLVLARWTQYQSANPNLFDGTMFCLDSDWRKQSTPTGRFHPYRYWYCLSREPELKTLYQVFPLAVSGVIVTEGGLLWGRRGHVTQDAGQWELPPSGGVDSSCEQKGGRLVLESQILGELHEELGVTREEVKSTQPLAFVLDHSLNLTDVVYRLEIDLSRNQLLQRARSVTSQEYTDFLWTPFEDLRHFLSNKSNRVSQTSGKLLEHLLVKGLLL